MKRLLKLVIILFLCNLSVAKIKAQSTAQRSSLSASFGLSIVVNANINYAYQMTKRSYISLGAGRIGGIFGGSGTHIDLTHFFLRGNTNHYFEFGYGVSAFFVSDDTDILPNIRLGYRKIGKKGNGGFFRTGISISDGLYIGKGFYF